MLNIGHHFLRYVLAVVIGPIVTGILWMGFGLPFFISVFAGVVGFGLTAIVTKAVQKRSIRKQFNLTKSEYKLIDEQLEEAVETTRTLSSLFTKVRSIKGFRQLYDMNKTAKRIINIVKNNPQKFYQAETFFYAHLPSVGELAEKYVTLSREKIKDHDVQIALRQTQHALTEYSKILEEDLRDVLADDIQSLKMELDFAQMTAKRFKERVQTEAELKETIEKDMQREPEVDEFEAALQQPAKPVSPVSLEKETETAQDVPFREPELVPLKKETPHTRMERRHFNN